MGFFARIKDYFTPAVSDESVILNINTTEVQFRQAEPDFDVYARPQAISATFGQVDALAPTPEDQRTAYRGLLAMLVRERAKALADAMCRVEVKRQLAPNDFEDVEDDHPWKILINAPSPDVGKFDFWNDAFMMRDIGRGGISAVGRNSMGVPEWLYLIYPDFGDVLPVPNTLGGIDHFSYTNNGGALVDIPREDIVWLRHRNPVTPYESASLLQQAAYNSDISLYQAIYARDMTSEGNVPPAYVSFKHDITPDQSKKWGEHFTRNYMKVGQKKKALVLGNDGKVETLGISPDDLQYIESAGLNDRQLMLIFGFPPAMFEASGVVANSQEVRRQWLQFLQLEVNQVCSAFTQELRIAFDARESGLTVMPPNVVPTNPLDEQRVRDMQLRTGQRSINEFRLDDGLEEIEGGEKYYISAGLQPLVEEAEEEPVMDEEDE